MGGVLGPTFSPKGPSEGKANWRGEAVPIHPMRIACEVNEYMNRDDDISVTDGGDATTWEEPHFRVRAVGAFHQRPGCPDHRLTVLEAAELDRLCRGECYHPSEQRKPIARIEVIRIRPQMHPDEPAAQLIEDPWLVLPCSGDPTGCVAEFRDPDYTRSGRDSAYYVRAIQEASTTIKAGGLRFRRDPEGRCLKARPCYGDERTDHQDDCLAEAKERAWSSPIYLLRAGGG